MPKAAPLVVAPSTCAEAEHETGRRVGLEVPGLRGEDSGAGAEATANLGRMLDPARWRTPRNASGARTSWPISTAQGIEARPPRRPRPARPNTLASRPRDPSVHTRRHPLPLPFQFVIVIASQPSSRSLHVVDLTSVSLGDLHEPRSDSAG